MHRYTYIAKSQPHKTVQGEIEAETKEEAINKVIKIGYFPVSVEFQDLSLERTNIFGLRKVPTKNIVSFTQQLSNLIEAGVNIIDSLNILSRQTNNKYLKAILNDVVSKIKDGKSLSDSLASHPYLFSKLYSSMIYTGEVSGNLSETLKRLANFMEKEEELKDSLRAGLTYPFFIFIVSVLTVFILLVFVIPRLVTMFEDMGQLLPLPTRILISISAFIEKFWWLMLVMIFVFIFLWRRIYRSPQGKISWDRFKLKLPILGQIVLRTEIGRFARTLSLLLSSGISISPSLDTSILIIDNQIIKLEVKKSKEQIAAGLSLSDSFKSSSLFPELIINIMAIGEETGALDKSLLRIAQDYEKDVERTLRGLTRLLEPLIILIMGLIVGFIVLSMLLPIFQINLIVR